MIFFDIILLLLIVVVAMIVTSNQCELEEDICIAKNELKREINDLKKEMRNR